MVSDEEKHSHGMDEQPCRTRMQTGTGTDFATSGLRDLHLRFHGQPKGVMVEHRGSANLVLGTHTQFYCG